MGGQDEDGDYLNDVVLFNTRTLTCKRVVEGDEWYSFMSGINQAA